MLFFLMLSLVSDHPRGEIDRHPEEIRAAHCPVQSQRGYVELLLIFPRQHNHLQVIMTSSNKCQRPEDNESSCSLQNDHSQIQKADAVPSVQQSSVFQRICESSPLLMGLLKGEENPSAKAQMSQKGTTVMDSSRRGPTRTRSQDPSTTHSGHFQPNVLRSSLGTEPSTYNYSSDVDRLPSSICMYRTNAEVLELINERVASFRARRHKPHHNWPSVASVPRHSTTFSSSKKDAAMHSFRCSRGKQSTIVTGQASEASDRLKGPRANPKLTSTPDKNGNIHAFKHSEGTKTPSAEVGPNQLIDKCATVEPETITNSQGVASWDKENVSLNVVQFQQYEDVSEAEEAVQQHGEHKESQAAAIFGEIGHEQTKGATSSSAEVGLNETINKYITAGVDLPERESDGSKFVSSEDGDHQTLRSEKVNDEHVTNVTHSLSALKELVARLDNVVTNAKMDDVSEVLLQRYWNGDRDNIHVFASTEYPQIMLEVAATCSRHEEDSPMVIQALPPRSSLCSHLPQECRSSWLSTANKSPVREPVSEVSSIPKHIAAKDQGNTILEPEDTGSVQSASANKQKSAKGMQSYKTTSKEVHSNVQVLSMRNISSKNAPPRDDNHEEQPLAHPSPDCGGETATNDHGAPSSVKKTVSVSVLKVPQYEDISDFEDPPQQHGKHKESQLAASCISDDEHLQTATVVGTPTHPSDGSPAKVKSHVQVESTSNAQLIAGPPQNCCCPYYIETVTGFEHVLCPKCDDERLIRAQTNGSESPSIVLKKKDESDDEMHDWLAVPLKVGDMTERGQVESDDSDREGKWIGTPNPVPVSASPLPTVLDTLECTRTQVQTISPVPPPEGMLEMEMDTPSSRNPSCESDSCETEDSCDYMPTQGRNYLTVPQQAWKNPPAPSAPGHKGMKTGFQRTAKWRRKKVLSKTNKSILVSDSEDEDDSRAKLTKKRKKSIPRHSENIGATSFNPEKRDSSEKDGHHDTVEETSTPEQLPRCTEELSVRNLSEDRAELLPSTETNDSLDDVNDRHVKKSRTSSSDAVSDCSIEEERRLETVQQLKPNPLHQSQVGQTVEAHGASVQPPQSKKTKRGLSLGHAEAQTGNAPLRTNREITSEGNNAAYKAKTKGKKNKKARWTARIYSDSSESDRPDQDGSSDVSDGLHVHKHRNIGQMAETKDGNRHVQQKASLLMTSERSSTDDKPEKGHVHKKAKTPQLSETEDSQDDLCDTPDTSTLHRLNKRLLPHKESPDKHPQCADGTSPSSRRRIVNRLYVQESSQSNERLQLCKQVPSRTHSADEQPCATANANAAAAATRKKADSKKKKSHWNSNKEGRLAPKSNSSNNSHPAVQFPSCKPSSSAPKQHLPASRQQLSRSHSIPPTPGLPRPHSKNCSLPTSAHFSAWDKVKGLWRNQYYPIPVHKKNNLGKEDSAKNDVHPVREAEPGPSNPSRVHRRRHGSYKSETPLMKKTKSEAKERTRDINYNPQRQHSHAVAGHYKWKNRRERRESEGSRRPRARRSSSLELEWD